MAEAAAGSRAPGPEGPTRARAPAEEVAGRVLGPAGQGLPAVGAEWPQRGTVSSRCLLDFWLRGGRHVPRQRMKWKKCMFVGKK